MLRLFGSRFAGIGMRMVAKAARHTLGNLAAVAGERDERREDGRVS
ncbi:MAG TPA: hypothetical protein VGB83_07365 [Actinomycetota bacterium]